MSVTKRIYVLLALCALSFAASACADSTAPSASASQQQVIQKDTGTPLPCEQTGSTVKC